MEVRAFFVNLANVMSSSTGHTLVDLALERCTAELAGATRTSSIGTHQLAYSYFRLAMHADSLGPIVRTRLCRLFPELTNELVG